MRYNNAKIKKGKNGERYYIPTIVPNIPIKDTDVFIYPIDGERFESMECVFSKEKP